MKDILRFTFILKTLSVDQKLHTALYLIYYIYLKELDQPGAPRILELEDMLESMYWKIIKYLRSINEGLDEVYRI